MLWLALVILIIGSSRTLFLSLQYFLVLFTRQECAGDLDRNMKRGPSTTCINTHSYKSKSSSIKYVPTSFLDNCVFVMTWQHLRVFRLLMVLRDDLEVQEDMWSWLQLEPYASLSPFPAWVHPGQDAYIWGHSSLHIKAPPTLFSNAASGNRIPGL
jgi:hypothetical protein